MYGWIGDTGDPDDWFSFYFSGYDGNSAIHSYNNPTVFDLIARARMQSNPAERATLYAQAQNLIARDIPLIPIAHAGVPILMSRGVEGIVPQPDGNERLETVTLK
jgi:ABC-type transport system substrate-binding protein